jgi:hypothetical protein
MLMQLISIYEGDFQGRAQPNVATIPELEGKLVAMTEYPLCQIAAFIC